MAVMLSTSLGDMVIDLHTESCPLACKNFLKLCKIKYYNNCLFHSVQKDFIAQTGDPTGTGKGGDSIYKFLYGEQARFFDDEIRPNLKHDKVGIVAMASAGENMNASQFYVTTREDLDYLDGKHTVFGEVAEGLDTLSRINEAYVDESNRPYKNIRVKTTCILDDPYDDPPGLAELIPDRSPEFRPEEGVDVRLEDDWVPMDEQKDPEEVEKIIREREAHSRAVVLEMIGDIPEAEVKPPENVLFVCKLNPVTQDEDLEVIFSRFGKVISADIIRDHKTGDSLCYGFIEFETQDACEAAYFKMDNVLIDDRRIHVDFSQSVSKLWNRYHRLGAKDDKEGVDKTKELPDKPRYQLKETDGQRGGTGKRYEMVFEDDNGTRTERSNKGADDRDFQSYKNDRSERSTDHERHINQRHEEGGRNYRGEREDINSHNRERGHDYRIKDERKRDMGDSRDREDEDSRDGRGREDSRDRRGREDSRDRRVREDSRDRRVREDSRDRKQVFRSSEDRQRDHRSYNSRDSRDRQGRDRTDREEKKQDNGEREDSKPEHRSERESRTDREEENGRRSEPGREYRGARSGGADGSQRKKSRTSNEGRQEDSRDGRRRG